MFDDADTDACMTVRFHLISNYDSFNRSRRSVYWSIQQPDHETNH